MIHFGEWWSTCQAPPQMAFDYVYLHPTVEWAFPPANRATLELLNNVKPVGTIVLPDVDAGTDLTTDDIVATGFYLDQSPTLDGVRYEVFKHSQASARPRLRPSPYH